MARFENNRLTPLKPSATHTKFATYDIETKNWNEFLMAGFYDGVNYVFCPTIDNLCNYIIRKKYRGWTIYAHYGGGFDHRFILDWVLKNKPDLRVSIIENHGLILGLKVYTHDKKLKWTFIDSFQVIKGGLKALTEIFDVEHKKLTADFKNMTTGEKDQLYLKHDVIGLYEVLEKFYSLDMLAGVSHKMTTSSLALSVFRLNFLKDTVLYKLDEEKEEFVRRGYYGGRTEIFKMLAYNVREYDVNSMYVSAMLNPLPCGSKGIWATGFDFDNPDIVGFIEVTAECPKDLHIPLLPVKIDGKLIFPGGKFKGVYFSAEVKEAIRLGYKIEIHRALMFPAAPYLKDYALHTWNLRHDNPGKNPVNQTAKLLGNGLYGKFAQARERTMIQHMDFSEGCEKGYTCIFPEYDLWRVPTFSDSPAILPYISAAITSYSRLTLHRFMNMYPEKVVYCDTDSVFIEDMELPSGDELGEMKFEYHWQRFCAIQPKFYTCNGFEKFTTETLFLDTQASKRAGSKKVYVKELSRIIPGKVKLRAKGFAVETLPWIFEDFQEALETRNYNKFFQQQEAKFTKLNEAIRVKDLLALVARKKGMKTEYNKRKVNRKNWTTKPIIIKGG